MKRQVASSELARWTALLLIAPTATACAAAPAQPVIVNEATSAAGGFTELPPIAESHPEAGRVRALRSRAWIALSAEDPRRPAALIELAEQLVLLARGLRDDAARVDPYAPRVALPPDVAAVELERRSGELEIRDLAAMPEPSAPERPQPQLMMLRPNARVLVSRADRLVSEAIHCYAEILSRFPSEPRRDLALHSRARLFAELGQRTSTLREYALLFEHFPHSPFVAYADEAFGAFFFDRGQFAESATYYESVVEANVPALTAQAEYRLGTVRMNLGDSRAAVQMLSRAARDARTQHDVALLHEIFAAAPPYFIDVAQTLTAAQLRSAITELTNNDVVPTSAIVLALAEQLQRMLRDPEALALVHEMAAWDPTNRCAYLARANDIAAQSGNPAIQQREQGLWVAQCGRH